MPVAVERLKAQEGIQIRFQDCVVIGDTPRDVACAKVHGGLCVGVATGRYPVEILREAGADLAVKDLSGTEEILGWILEAKAVSHQ